MKQNPFYSLQEIAGKYYLLPFGQGLAFHSKGIEVNETGVFLWKELAYCSQEEELFAKMVDHFSPAQEDLTEMRQELCTFLKQLSSMGIVQQDHYILPMERTFEICLNIAGLRLKYVGPETLFAMDFLPFVEDHTQSSPFVDQEIYVLSYGAPYLAHQKLLLRNQELSISLTEEFYLIEFHNSGDLKTCHLSLDGKKAYFYYPGAITPEVTLALFHGIRFSYLYLAQKRGLFAIHSASLLYREKGWVFAGSSGTGKSTHTNLWQEVFHTPLLNGDLNLLGDTPDGPVIYGLPWCGTSGISTKKTYPLGGIILLKQNPTNLCLVPEKDKQILYVMQRLISPAWQEHMLQQNLAFANLIAAKVPVWRLLCTKEPSAVQTIKEVIDHYFSQDEDNQSC